MSDVGSKPALMPFLSYLLREGMKDQRMGGGRRDHTHLSESEHGRDLFSPVVSLTCGNEL